MTRRNGELRALVWEHFDVVGETTSWELAEALGIPRSTAAGVLSSLEKAVKRYIHISHYTRDVPGCRRTLRAVYALGDLPNGQQPRRESNRLVQSRARLKRMTRVTSIFDLARIPLSLARREAQLKGKRCNTSQHG